METHKALTFMGWKELGKNFRDYLACCAVPGFVYMVPGTI
jgi:hypothetical protein